MTVRWWYGRERSRRGRLGRLGGLAGVALLGSTSGTVTGVTPAESLAARFTKGTLAVPAPADGGDPTQITTLDFGPDGRLYAGEVHGTIAVYDVTRSGPGSYRARPAETITAVQEILNHDDDGVENIEDVTRQVTGLVVTGTSRDPVIYVTSSDPRQGGGPDGTDTGLDTNSGVVSRLDRDNPGGRWRRFDLVRGLPRSEENHSPNGLALSADGRVLFVAQGGLTNNGAPSREFAYLREYALSAAILRIDLDAIDGVTYDLPTLDDQTRSPAASGAPGGYEDDGDPFGGNDGRNQALLVPGGPVAVHASGFRNPYDVVVAGDGRVWTVDNGANPGWGDVPDREGPGGRCTNGRRAGGAAARDVLHLVDGPGYYGGHPNPTRANRANRFGDQSPVTVDHPVECDHRAGGGTGARATFPASTNGLAEYASSAGGRGLAGDLLTVGFDNTLYRVEVKPGGTVGRTSVLFPEVSTLPLDLTVQEDGERFPGTVWVGDYASGVITVFEPR